MVNGEKIHTYLIRLNYYTEYKQNTQLAHAMVLGSGAKMVYIVVVFCVCVSVLFSAYMESCYIYLNKQMFNIDFNDVWLVMLRMFLQLLWKPVQINTFIEISFLYSKQKKNEKDPEVGYGCDDRNTYLLSYGWWMVHDPN